MTYDHRRYASQYEAAFRKLEEALEAHPVLKSAGGRGPWIEIDRFGVEAHVDVRKHGKGKARGIMGKGSSPEAAIDELIKMLDYWAEKT